MGLYELVWVSILNPRYSFQPSDHVIGSGDNYVNKHQDWQRMITKAGTCSEVP